MKCPVCKTEIPEQSKYCDCCNFRIDNTSFLTMDDAEAWLENVVKPYRSKWKQEQEAKNFLIHGQYYDRIKDLRTYLSNTPNDVRATVEYVGLLYDTLFEPKYPMAKGEPEYIAHQCIDTINSIALTGDDPLTQYRRLRLNHMRATMHMVLGDLCEAYDLFCEVARELERISSETKFRFNDAMDMLFRAEINIHQIKEMVGIDDSQFFSTHRTEISFFERYAEVNFSYDGALCLSALIPLMAAKRNPIYDIEDRQGNFVGSFGYGGMFFGMFLGWLGYSNVLTYRYWPINLYSNVSRQQYHEWTWRVEVQNVDRNAIRSHIEAHPYTKQNGYLATIVARAYARKK